jgi:hypothetical protein
MVELTISQTEILLKLHLNELKKTQGMDYEPIQVNAVRIDQYILVNIKLQQPKHELSLRDFFEKITREYLFPAGVILHCNEECLEAFTSENLEAEFHDYFKTPELIREVTDFLNSQ